MSLTVGAMFSGALIYAMFGAAGAVINTVIPLRLAAFIVVALVLFWYLLRASRFPGSLQGRQANRELARSRPGVLYFGMLLGTGLFTQMSTPLVFAGLALSLAEGAAWGALFGVGFGLGRSAPALAGPFLAASAVSPVTAANAVTVRFQPQARALGLATAAATLIVLGWSGVP